MHTLSLVPENNQKHVILISVWVNTNCSSHVMTTLIINPQYHHSRTDKPIYLIIRLYVYYVRGKRLKPSLYIILILVDQLILLTV